ncbi:MAG: outer membrane beta-barrel protein [Alphaproteobacteria bacterium]|nr:outer membrane beta-barrel protein [Alphaproteobacteria bacterium]
MKKSLLFAATALLFASVANAGPLTPYVGFDYVNMAPNVADSLPENYDVGSINAGLRYDNAGALELFYSRSMREKSNNGNMVTRGRLNGYGADLLISGYDFSQASILGSVGYGRFTTKMRDQGGNRNETGNVVRLGVGGEINPTLNWGFRAMFRYSLADSEAFKNAKEFSVGARYYFY